MNELDEYLRANRDAYTRDALTQRLVEAGHDPAAVEEAWSRIGAGPITQWAASDGPVEAPGGQAGIGTVLLAIALFLGYGGSILLAAVAISYGSVVSILMIVYVVAMIAGLVYSLRRLFRAPRAASGWGPIWIAVGLSVAIFVGLSGACFAALGPAMNAAGRTII
jgi:hypothetical protein